MSEILDLSSANSKIDLRAIQNNVKKNIEEEIDENDENDFDLQITPPPITIDELTGENKENKIEDNSEKRNKVSILKRYIDNFPEYLGEYKGVNFMKYSMFELNEYHEEFKLKVSSTNSNQIAFVAYEQILNVLEGVGPTLKLDLKGLSSLAKQNKAIENCIKEISIEYSTKINYIKPEYRLILLTGAMCFSVNNMNKKNTIINEFLEKPVEKDFKNNYKDL